MASKLGFVLTGTLGTISHNFLKLPRTCACITLNTTIHCKYILSLGIHMPKISRLCSTNSYPSLSLSDEKSARNFLLGLDVDTRDILQREMEKIEEERVAAQFELDPSVTITPKQAWKVFIFNGVPFIGFGLLDNVIMIIAGEYIDATIGTALGISTMAAAALGNLISDLAGVGTAGYVEVLASRCGIQTPEMTPAQSLTSKTRYMVALGRGVGVTLGCLLGMFPLLFFSHKDESPKEVIIEIKGATTIEKAAQTDPLSVKPK